MRRNRKNPYMRNYTLSLAALLCSATALVAQTWQWANPSAIEYSNTSPQLCTYPAASAAQGGVITAGYHNSEFLYNGSIYGSVAVRAFEPSGEMAWERIVDGEYVVCHLASDAQGNVYMAGMKYIQSVQLPERPVLIKLDDSGDIEWEVEINDLISGIEEIRAVEITASQRIFLGCNDQVDSYLIEVNDEGEMIGSVLQSSVGSITSIVEDELGNIYAAGGCAQMDADFAGAVPNNGAGTNTYVVAYSSAGEYLWSHFVNDIHCSDAKLLAMPNGNIIFSSHLRGQRTFGEFSLTGPPTAFNPDFFVACLNAEGEFLWAREAPGNGRIEIATRNPIAVDPLNNVYFTGRIQGATYWENEITTFSSGANDIVVLKFDEDGVVQQAWTAGGSFEDRADAIVVNANGAIYISGISTGNINFGEIQHAAPQGILYPFVAQLADNTVFVESISEGKNGVYPNPCQDVFTVNAVKGTERIEIYDVNGRKVMMHALQSNNQINVSALPKGVYTIRMLDENAFLFTEKLIIE